jgi:hypothetical protein
LQGQSKFIIVIMISKMNRPMQPGTHTCQGLYFPQEPGVMLAQYVYRKNQTQKEIQFIAFHFTSYMVCVNSLSGDTFILVRLYVVIRWRNKS